VRKQHATSFASAASSAGAQQVVPVVYLHGLAVMQSLLCELCAQRAATIPVQQSINLGTKHHIPYQLDGTWMKGMDM
jgi:hypothetical protein